MPRGKRNPAPSTPPKRVRSTSTTAQAPAAPQNELEAPTSTAVESPVLDATSDTVLVALNRAQGITFILDDGRRVDVAGNAVHLKGKDSGILPTGGAFGLTRIKAADWDAIVAKFGTTALFRSGRIFAHHAESNVRAEAREKAHTRHGLEPATGRQTHEAKAEVF